MNDKKITDYILLHSDYKTDLQNKVNDYIQAGWQPFGSPQVPNDKFVYFQAMVIAMVIYKKADKE